MSLQAPLSILSRCYGAAIGARNAFWDRAWLRPHALPVPVISVGNLSLGGTGKTPAVAQICSLLRLRNHRPGILSRGYGRKSRKDVILTGRERAVSWTEIGDEPAMLFRRLRCPMGIGADRVATASQVLSCTAADCLVLDDGFQHRSLGRTLDLVVIDADRPPWKDRLLPAGLLREPLSSLGRASGFLVKGEDSNSRLEAVEQLKRHFPGRPVFTSELRTSGVRQLGTDKLQPVSFLADRRLAAFAAIAHPARFERLLLREGCRLAARRWFRDHHVFSTGQLGALVRDFEREGAQIALTTEKDAARLDGLPMTGMPVYVLDVEMVIFQRDEFAEWLCQAWKH